MFRTLMTSVALVAAAAAAAAATADQAATSGAATHLVAAAATKPKAPADAGKTPIAEARTSKVAQSGKEPRTSKDAQAVSDETGKDDDRPAGDVKMSGMSILGNEDAPKSLVIVPWKSARIGKMPGMSMMLDDSVQPVDKDVFMRELAYYRIRAGAP